ncbi:AABR07073146.1 [Phodopus roborovskii]|uniref:AABR07073146.1 protein n=1 Tax=Phodopus roborovskii TaxID=109678 RepID=A0AAU9ZDQ9_PHORO|nr:AABR07073146.1 [Phodopus roborovskii]
MGVRLTKHYVLPIQPITLRTCDKELAAVCTGTTVCLIGTKYTLSKFKIFICKRTSVNTSDSSTISLSRNKVCYTTYINKISTLNHEILYDPGIDLSNALPMEGTSFVPYRNTIFSVTKKKDLDAELPKRKERMNILCRLWHHVCKQLDLHATNFLSEAPTSAVLAQPVSGGLQGAPRLPPSPVSCRPPAPHLAADADIKEDHRIDWT